MEKTHILKEHPAGRSCEKCFYFGVMKSGATVCRFEPPKIFGTLVITALSKQGLPEDGKWNTSSFFPQTTPDQWCGKFTKLPDG